MTLQLRPMTVEEFAAFRIYEIDDHAGDLSLRDQISIEDAQELAQSQFEALLPQGANTDGHEFHTVLEDEHPVGKLWIREERRSDKDRRVVVWKIEIDEPFRGRGLGRELMKLVERLALEKEARAIELYVFGHNARARALYESLGYQVLGTQMRKELHPLCLKMRPACVAPRENAQEGAFRTPVDDTGLPIYRVKFHIYTRTQKARFCLSFCEYRSSFSLARHTVGVVGHLSTLKFPGRKGRNPGNGN